MDHLGNDHGERHPEAQEGDVEVAQDLELDEVEGAQVTGGVLTSFLWIGSRGSGPSGSS